MKRRYLAALILIGVTALAACGGEGTASPQPPITPSNAGDSPEPRTPDMTAHRASTEGATIAAPASPTVISPSETPSPADNAGPSFNRITASTIGFAKSDCSPTSVTVTANITDPSGVARAALWYQVGFSHPYTSVDMDSLGGNDYSATVKGLDVPGSEYGVWKFYITAQDGVGNVSQSALDTSVQLLPCVG